MNAYTTRGQARIQPSDLSAVMRAYPLVGTSLAALERERGWQADAELERLLKQHGLKPHSPASLVSLLRQTIGAALVRAGEHLTDAPRIDVSPETAPAPGTLTPAG
jgi:hypothetical protein